MTLEDQVMRDPGGDGEKLCGRRGSFRFVHCLTKSSNGLLGDVLPFPRSYVGINSMINAQKGLTKSSSAL